MSKFSLIPVNISKVTLKSMSHESDLLSIEEPLEIQIVWDGIESQSISVTMCTPGNEKELAVGFLFTEGILKDSDQLLDVSLIENRIAEDGLNGRTVLVRLKEPVDLNHLKRNFYTTSSCGVCGKSSIDAVKIACPVRVEADPILIDKSIVFNLPQRLQQHQDQFAFSGGIHASALFDLKGELLFAMEDVGRHNALDKLIGRSYLENQLPINQHILLLSGRASFELIQKASMAGIQVVCAIGAPSSLAVELAEELNITLLGFLRNQRFNIYSAESRIRI